MLAVRAPLLDLPAAPEHLAPAVDADALHVGARFRRRLTPFPIRHRYSYFLPSYEGLYWLLPGGGLLPPLSLVPCL